MIKQFSALVAMLAVACGGPSITSKRDSSVPLPQAPSWAWGPRDTISRYELDPAAQNPMLHQRVQAAVESTLARKGWKEVNDPKDAQVVVTYHVGLKRSTELVSSTTGGGYGGWWGGYGWGYYGAPSYAVTRTTAVEYMDGGLLVIVRNAASGDVAWEGLFKKQVSDPHKVTEQGIQKAVEDLLSELK